MANETEDFIKSQEYLFDQYPEAEKVRVGLENAKRKLAKLSPYETLRSTKQVFTKTVYETKDFDAAIELLKTYEMLLSELDAKGEELDSSLRAYIKKEKEFLRPVYGDALKIAIKYESGRAKYLEKMAEEAEKRAPEQRLKAVELQTNLIRQENEVDKWLKQN